MKHTLSLLTLLAAGAFAAADDVRSRPLIFHAPAPAARAMQYALLPDLMETTPGNAADHYRRAIPYWKEQAPPEAEWVDMFERLLRPPLKDLPLDEIAGLLKRCEPALREVEAGARCEQCEWGQTDDLRRTGRSARENEAPVLNALGCLLAVRCRYEIAHGRTQDAARTLRIGFALARHIADAPSFYDAVYGMDVGQEMLELLEEILQRRDAPDFYWPLTDLPRPLFDLRKALQAERIAVYGYFPGATDMAADRNAKPWASEQVEKAIYVLRHMGPGKNRFQFVKDQAEMMLRIAAQHEAAKKALLDEGRPKELVDAMPHVQVALLAALRQWDQAFDEALKCQSLPYPERLAAWSKARARQQEMMDDPNGPAIPLWRLHARDGRNWLEMAAECDRRAAALRCVEAVRLYAAGHDSRFPASLDEIKDTPIPLDPVDCKPFGYRRAGDRAFLSSSPFPGRPATYYNTPTYELIFER
jgi:hypothetical protein